MVGIPEFRAAFHEADFGDGKAQVMEPFRIRAGWDQADRCHASLALIQRPRHPLRDILAVGWIHPADAFPWLFQPVVGLGVVFRALGIFIRCGHVHRESELAVERVEDIGGRCPFHGVAFESGIEVGHNMKRKMENKGVMATGTSRSSRSCYRSPARLVPAPYPQRSPRKFPDGKPNQQQNMKHRLKSMSALAATLITFGSLAGGASAAIVVNITDNGVNLTMTATGTYDFSSLTPNSGSGLGANAGVGPAIDSGGYGWEASGVGYILSPFSGTLTGLSNAFPASFVSTTNPFWINVATSSISFGAGTLAVGSVNESATFNGATLASLGMISGQSISATWTGGDSITIQTSAVPEPSSALLFGFAALGFAARRRRTN